GAICGSRPAVRFPARRPRRRSGRRGRRAPGWGYNSSRPTTTPGRRRAVTGSHPPQERAQGSRRMPDPAHRRAVERYPVNAETSCPFVARVAEDFGGVRIKDISMQGIGLVTGRRVDPGTLLAVTLSNPARGFHKTVLVRVAHATAVPGGCLVGGTFDTPL